MSRSLLEHRVATGGGDCRRDRPDAPNSTVGLVDALYSKIDPMLKLAAERNVAGAFAEAADMRAGRSTDGEVWRAA